LAAENGHEAIVGLLLKRDGVDLEAKDIMGENALWKAAVCGEEGVVRLLLERHGIHTNLDEASEGKKLSIIAVENLLRTGIVELNSVPKAKLGKRPLNRATANGHNQMVQLLLDNGDDPNAHGDGVRTPLTLASEQGREDLVKLLLERGADPNL
jgi:ankyrin repeat protein